MLFGTVVWEDEHGRKEILKEEESEETKGYKGLLYLTEEGEYYMRYLTEEETLRHLGSTQGCIISSTDIGAICGV